MRRTISLFSIVTAVALPLGSGAIAGTLSGQDAAGVLVSQDRTFAAGSVSSFNADGTYAFRHANGTDQGRFTVTKDGKVTLKHASGPGKGKKDVFVVDETNGQYSVKYVSGRFKGQSFKFK